MPEFIPRLQEDERLLSQEISPPRILARVALGLLFDNPLAARSITTKLGQNVESVALIGEPAQTTTRSSGGEQGIRLGYHYAYRLEDPSPEWYDTRVGIIIANPRVYYDRRRELPADRNLTMRQYITGIEGAFEREDPHDISSDLFIPGQPGKVFRADFVDRNLAATGAVLETDLITPLTDKQAEADHIAKEFKEDILAILAATPVITDSDHQLKELIDL